MESIHTKWGYAATEQLRTEADKGDPNAMFGMWVMGDPGERLSPNNADAMRWLQKAAEAGHAEAQVYWGHSLEWNKPGDMVQALRWYKLASEQHHPGGECHLALCYLRGKGVEKDEERGLEFMRLAADHGQPYSIAKLADLYARGIGEPRDGNDRPMALLLRAANLGFAPAYESLWLRYQQGLGTLQDLVASAKWYCERVAANSFLVPKFNETVLTQSNTFSPPDPFEETLRLFYRAIKSNDSTATFALGRRYANGEHAPIDAPSAWQWFNLAANQGSSEAASARDHTEQQMSVDELATAKSCAGAFRDGLVTLAGKLPEINAHRNP